MSMHFSRKHLVGNIDGFLGLFLDNLVQIIVITSLSMLVLGFPVELIYTKVLPGIAISLALGNFFYAYQANQLAKRENRTDVCALPYGINTLTIFIYIFLILLPAKLHFESLGKENAHILAWQLGLAACFLSGVIEFFGSFIAKLIKKIMPRVAMLATLSGIAISFISFPFFFKVFHKPVIGITTLFLLLVFFIHGFRLYKLSGGIIVLILGMIIAYANGFQPTQVQGEVGFYPPILLLSDFWAGMKLINIETFIRFILPMGIFNLIGSIQNLESAEASGDKYEVKSSLIVNGLGSMIAGVFGSCFPTTIYIGHPAWKKMGARSLYSSLNALVFILLITFGFMFYVMSFIPLEAIMVIMIWIGLIISIQAFEVSEKKYYIAIFMGIFPAVASWGISMVKAGFRAGGNLFTADKLYPALNKEGIDIVGGLHLEQGFIFTCIIFAAMTVYIIDKNFIKASITSLIAALLAWIGLVHGYELKGYDSILSIKLGNYPFVFAYISLAIILFIIDLGVKKKFIRGE